MIGIAKRISILSLGLRFVEHFGIWLIDVARKSGGISINGAISECPHIGLPICDQCTFYC